MHGQTEPAEGGNPCSTNSPSQYNYDFTLVKLKNLIFKTCPAACLLFDLLPFLP